MAVLGTLGFPEGTVPGGFAVPFYFYDEFMKANGLYDDIEEMLADTVFQTDFDTQESELKKLRKKIKKAETPQWIIDALTQMHETFPERTSLRYRSSTNNEDLPGFSGAGLYDSKTQDPEETEDDGIDKSIKGVWASLWNFRAFVERGFHRIDHTKAAMGVLVHPNYSGELVNGVAVSFDPVSTGDGAYYVNSQVGEDLVTNPEAHSAPEEVLLYPDGTRRILALSNQILRGQLLMTRDQLRQLRRHLATIHERFGELYGIEDDEQFAMEIEFKITNDNVLAIKQARPWVFGAPNQPQSNQPQSNQPPAFPATERGVRSVAENMAAGQAIGAPVAAVDPNADDTLTYSLSGDDDASFDIVASTGQLQARAALDYETGESYTVTVSVHDGKDANGDTDTAIDDSIAVTILVNRPATGAPAISGTAQVGETLTAGITGISDADGLDNAALRLPVAGRRRGHHRRDIFHLHPGCRRRGQGHQGAGQLHRRPGPLGVADQQSHGRGDGRPGTPVCHRGRPHPDPDLQRDPGHGRHAPRHRLHSERQRVAAVPGLRVGGGFGGNADPLPGGGGGRPVDGGLRRARRPRLHPGHPGQGGGVLQRSGGDEQHPSCRARGTLGTGRPADRRVSGYPRVP